MYYSSIDTIPGDCAGPDETIPPLASESLTGGANIFEMHRAIAELEIGDELPEVTQVFLDGFNTWSTTREGDYTSRYPQFQQRQILLGMIKNLRTTPEKFFAEHESHELPQIFHKYTARRCQISYPDSTYSNIAENKSVVMLPVIPRTDPSRSRAYRILTRNPDYETLRNMPSGKLLHLFAVAYHEVFIPDIVRDAFLLTFGLTITVPQVIAMQARYIHHLKKSTDQ